MIKKWELVLFVALACALTFNTGIGNSQTKEIVIGAPNSLTGGYGEGGRQVIAGLELAFTEVNSQGGIRALSGAKLKLIAADTSSDNPSQASSVTRRLIVQDKAVVLVGSHTSTMTLSSQIEAEREQVPIITTSYADAIVQRGYKYTFKIPSNSTRNSEATDQYIYDMYKRYKGTTLKRVAIFYGTDASNQFAGKAALELAKKRGLDIVASGSFPSGTTDPTPIVGPVNQEKPEALFVLAFPGDTILVTRAVRGLGLKMPIVSVGTGISVKSVGEALGNSANGLMGLIMWNWDLPIEGVSKFYQNYKVAYPKEPYPPQEAGEGYAIGWLIKEVLEKARSTDSKVIRNTLASIDIPTILPGRRIGFDENGLNKHMVPIMVGWLDGELRTVWPYEYKTRDPFIP